MLIPEIKGSKRPADYRPITIADLALRLFHKILARRIESVIPLSPVKEGSGGVMGCGTTYGS